MPTKTPKKKNTRPSKNAMIYREHYEAIETADNRLLAAHQRLDTYEPDASANTDAIVGILHSLECDQATTDYDDGHAVARSSTDGKHRSVRRNVPSRRCFRNFEPVIF